MFRTEARNTYIKVTVVIMSSKRTPHRSNPLKKRKKQNIDRITEPALIRILRRAGVVRARKDIYPTMRECISRFIKPILYNSWIIALNNKRKTLKKKHLCQAMMSLGLDLVCLSNNLESITTKNKSKKSSPSKDRTGGKRADPGENALEEVKRLQNSDELLITRLPIERLIKEYLKEISGGIKSSSLFILTSQLVIEVFLTNLVKDSFDILNLEEGKTHKSLTKVNVESAFRLTYKKFYLLSLIE